MVVYVKAHCLSPASAPGGNKSKHFYRLLSGFGRRDFDLRSGDCQLHVLALLRTGVVLL
jgi:hypothetical protein